ncbi:MAG: phage tail tape measure protein, partial [Gammaproteobacteria bacterium]
MADAKRTIELVFEGVDKTAAATQSALNNTNKFAGNLQSATQPIADFTASAVKLEASLLAAGVAITAFSVKVASDFQSAVADLSKVLSDTDSIEQYKDLAIE